MTRGTFKVYAIFVWYAWVIWYYETDTNLGQWIGRMRSLAQLADMAILFWNNVEAFTLVLESYVSVQQSLLYTSWRRLEKLKKMMSWKFWGSLLHLISTNQAPWSPQIFMSRIYRSKNLKLDEATAYSNQRTCRRYILLSVYSQDVPQHPYLDYFMQILQPWVVWMLFVIALLARSNQVS